MKRLLYILALSFIFCFQVSARVKYFDYAKKGGKNVATSSSINYKLMETYPNCTVTVYLAGTLTPAAIYTNNSGTVKSNPFTADSNAYFEFYVDNGRYDIKFSGTGISTPFTRADVSISDATSITLSLSGDVTGLSSATVANQARGLRETSGPTTLNMGNVADGQFLKRVGSTIVGGSVAAQYTPTGALCNNSANDTAAFSAVLALIGSTKATLQIPNGICRIDSLTFPSNVTLDFGANGGLYANNGRTVVFLGPQIGGNDKRFYNGDLGTFTFAQNTFMTTFQASWFGVMGNSIGSVDVTTEFQVAIIAALTKDAAVLELPSGKILVNGALSGTAGHQSVLRFVNTNGETAFQSLTIRGQAPPPYFSQTVNVPGVYINQGTIIYSTGDNGYVGAGDFAGGFTRLNLTIENITIRTKDNPTRGGIDGTFIADLEIKDSTIDTGQRTYDCSQPTHPTASAFIWPATGNGQNRGSGYNLMAQCYYNGFVPGEHFSGDNLNAIGNINGIYTQEGYHAAHIGRYLSQSNSNGLVAGATLPIIIEEMAVESGNGICQVGIPAYQAQVTTVSDPTNILFGKVAIHVNHPCTNAVDLPVVIGAFYLATPVMAPITALFGANGFQPYTLVTNSVDQTIPDDGNLHDIFFDTELQDVWNGHSTSVNTNRINCTKAGVATITFNGKFASNATGIRMIRMFKNGATQLTDVTINATGGGQPTGFSQVFMGTCNAPTDYFSVQGKQTSTGNLAISAHTVDSPTFSLSIVPFP